MFAEISSNCVTIGDTKIPILDDFSVLPKIKTKALMLVANTQKTAIRVAKIPHGKKLSQEAQWTLVEENFPIGEKMNENTHIFDGSIFKNENGQSRFLIAALPVIVSERITEIGVALTGSIHRIARLDTIEHITFKKYCAETNEPALVFLPQDYGIRILHIAENLPAGSFFISNDPLYREDEFSRFYNSLDSPPEKFIFTEENEEFSWLRLPMY